MAARVALAGVLVAIGLGGAACNKDKKQKTTPTATKGESSEETERMSGGSDPVSPWEEGAAGPGKSDASKASSGDSAAARNDGDPSSESGATPGQPPAIAPPDLDLSADEQNEQVATHLRAAWAALRGDKKDPDRAIAEARAALAADATNVDAIVVIAHAYCTKNLYDTAEVVLDMTFKERKKAKSNPGFYYVYGVIYDHTDRPEQAMVAYQKAVDLAPSYKSALVNLGAHYLRNQRYAEAARLYEKLTGELGVTSALAYTNLGTAYRGQWADYPANSPRRAELVHQAEGAYKRAIATDGKYANVYYNLGLLYLDIDPFPGPSGAPLDLLDRLARAKTYFDEYRSMTGADLDLVERRVKEVDKLVKREEKRRQRDSDKKSKKKSGSDDW